MAQLEPHQHPSKIFRGSIEEVFSHRSEISPDATVELKVFEDQPESAQEAAATPGHAGGSKVLRGRGMLAGVLSTEKFMRRKQEDLDLEDRQRR